MSTTIDAIFRPDELRDAWTEVIDEQIKELRAFSRRANSPAKRVVLSAFEQRISTMRAEMEQAGTVNPLPKEAA